MSGDLGDLPPALQLLGLAFSLGPPGAMRRATGDVLALCLGPSVHQELDHISVQTQIGGEC